MNYEGDPKIYHSGTSTDLAITDGQPAMDEGLENAVTLSLFTSRGWWGNAVSAGSEQFGSDLASISRRTLTNQTRLDAEEFARQALAWLVDDGITKAVTVTGTIPAVGMLGLTINIEQPDKISTIRFQINWTTMAVRVGAA